MTESRKQRLDAVLALLNTNESAKIGLNTPLRLTIAAALAYPDGSMTASGLRREAAGDGLRSSASQARTIRRSPQSKT